MAIAGGLLLGWFTGHKLKKNKADMPLAIQSGGAGFVITAIGIALCGLAYYLGSSTDLILSIIVLVVIHIAARNSVI